MWVVFTLVVSCCDGDWMSAGGIAVNVFILLQVWVAGLSGADAATMLMRMLAAAGVSKTLTNQGRQSAALFCAPDIHSRVMLYMVSSSDHQFTLLFAFLAIEKLLQRYVVIVHEDVRSLEIEIPFCYGIIDTIGLLFCSPPFLISVYECVWKTHDW